jgi:leucyl-tRNA synthetase
MTPTEYNHKAIEEKWQRIWAENQTYKTESETSGKPKYYVLDMFPYPSGAGLHVGHPLGYIASDIVSRYKRALGFNVLHPMGFDSFGLPAEQYAIETGQHPAKTTEKNIARYVEQLKRIGFSYDWEREVRTSDPSYYKWTQWIFIQLFESWYNKKSDRAEAISDLVAEFEKNGNQNINANCDEEVNPFSASDWKAFSEQKKAEVLLQYRLAYVADTFVNWCPALGTVLANDEVKDGFSERGGHPVERKEMRQWSLRITAYADRLLRGLDALDWSDAVKEMQRNWIGKSQGASLWFDIEGFSEKIEVFTTRIDTTFGVTFLSLAPEHPLVEKITTAEKKSEVEAYLKMAQSKSERDRMADVKTISGAFTGAFAINPFNGEKVQIWIADYVLAGYGTGAVMAVPSSDTRDYAFAKHFGLPIISVQEGPQTDISKDDFDPKAGTMINSGFLNGLPVKEAIAKATAWAEEKGIGKGKINYRMRDAIFGRQRYWGEPVPVYYENGIPKALPKEQLPLVLPEIDQFKPTETGEPPLGRAKGWGFSPAFPPLSSGELNRGASATGQGVRFNYELSTMPGWAGSSWYFLRYMDPKNHDAFVSEKAEKYWQSVDLYLGGTEHATGHLLYSRFWHKFLKDRGFVSTEEPFQKLVNQGMIQGRSNVVYRLSGEKTLVSKGLIGEREVSELYVDVNIVKNDILDIEAFKDWRSDFSDAKFELEDGQYVCGWEVEKMSKSKYNVVNPDDICEQYGADTLRLYEMFLGPLEQSKPWNTNGIEGVFRFLRKLWNLFQVVDGKAHFSVGEPSKEELKALHRVIKKTSEDIENLSLKTSVSSFMVAVNELSALKCSKKDILTNLLIVIAPYAPHICEELWEASGMPGSVTHAPFPTLNPAYLVDDEVEYPISVNGKVRDKIVLPADTPPGDVEKQVLALESVQKWLEGKAPKKVIVVPKKIVNVVI